MLTKWEHKVLEAAGKQAAIKLASDSSELLAGLSLSEAACVRIYMDYAASQFTRLAPCIQKAWSIGGNIYNKRKAS